jgi:hypothetical protein
MRFSGMLTDYVVYLCGRATDALNVGAPHTSTALMAEKETTRYTIFFEK